MKLAYTRAMITAALEGKLDNVEFEKDDVFGFSMPTSCPGVPTEVINHKNTWEVKQAFEE